MRLRVRVPATTANVGSGFDCVGIALAWYDELELVSGGPGLRVNVHGEGAGRVPLDDSHLVIEAMRRGLEEWADGVMPEASLTCRNAIPHARGLGSSAAAIVAGLALAWGLARDDDPDAGELSRVSSLLEGHADNAAAAVHGGATLGWLDGDTVTVHRLRLHADLVTRVWIPELEVPTTGARATLPAAVPHSHAVAQAASAATLVLALEHRPELLMRATDDHLHQEYRRHLMPQSWSLMERLRDVGVPAAISGAGPAVFAIGRHDEFALAFQVPAEGFRELSLPIGAGAALIR